MKVYEHLDEETVKKLKQEQTKEKLSKRDLADLMGTNRPTYRRKNGAWRSN